MSLCPKGYVEVIEGLARICIPDPKLYTRPNGVFEPAIAPVFYNPDMVENRDIAVTVVDYIAKKKSKTKELVVVEPFAATGVRGIRIAQEVSKPEHFKVVMGDISDEAIKIINLNINLNNLFDKVMVEKSDANELLYRLRRIGIKIDYVDVDPFGSPAPFTHSAIANIRHGGIVAFTATDLAVLEGKYPDKLFRRYGVEGSITPISKDITVRVLLSYIARTAYIFDRYIEPMLSYVYKHHARVYVRVFEGATKANNQARTCLRKIVVCSYCSYNKVLDLYEHVNTCPLCGSQAIEIKPIWVCKTVDREVIEILVKDLESKPWILKSSKQLLKTLYEYSFIDSLTLRLSLLARALKINTPPKAKIIECLRDLGYKTVKSCVYHDGIISTATVDDVVRCMKS
jgi:tRNA (guanine26-N2/guanine27-N2)-dimethyltransferase